MLPAGTPCLGVDIDVAVDVGGVSLDLSALDDDERRAGLLSVWCGTTLGCDNSTTLVVHVLLVTHSSSNNTATVAAAVYIRGLLAATHQNCQPRRVAALAVGDAGIAFGFWVVTE